MNNSNQKSSKKRKNVPPDPENNLENNFMEDDHENQACDAPPDPDPAHHGIGAGGDLLAGPPPDLSVPSVPVVDSMPPGSGSLEEEQQQQQQQQVMGGDTDRRTGEPTSGGADPPETQGHEPSRVSVSAKDRAAQMIVTDDTEAAKAECGAGNSDDKTTTAGATKVTSHKGYRTARATHAVQSGAYYFEVTLKHLGKTGHARVGWCTRDAELHAPVGADAHGFCIRDINGAVVHAARRKHYARKQIKDGDVVGCYINVPAGDGEPAGAAAADDGANGAKELVKLGGAMYFKSAEVGGQSANEKTAPGGTPKGDLLVAFSVNGVACSDEVAFQTPYTGKLYYPAVSLYTSNAQVEGATLAVNFGPEFRHPPTADAFPACCPAPQPASALVQVQEKM